ncbi:LCP family protein [Candidatus Saccharibacteria bacterium]|nr:LCP family protein [Candidatus Saccharibacteria bacterium]
MLSLFSRNPGMLIATPEPKPRHRIKRGFIIVGVVLLIGIIGVGGWTAYKFVTNTNKVASGGILGLLSATKLSGESTGRVNILLAGNSADDPGHGGAQLTDSLMVVSLDTANNTAYMLSIPRDLWVNVPGHGYEKINAVYPQGGMSLLEQVVSDDLGVNINYYTLVDYTAFKQAVDAVGGISVTIASTDARGIYDPNVGLDNNTSPLSLTNGVHVLSGETALELARARNDPTPNGNTGYGLPNGDFDRAANQRLMLVALKDKVASASTFTNPVKISELLDALGSNVKTDFTTSDLRRLVELSKTIPSTSITSVSLTTTTSGNLLASYSTTDGQDAIIPAAGVNDFSAIQSYIANLNAGTATASPSPASKSQY